MRFSVILIFFIGFLSFGKGESASFSEIFERDGLPRCISVAANTARQFTVSDLKRNRAWSLAAAICASGRIGGRTDQLTGTEFAEVGSFTNNAYGANG